MRQFKVHIQDGKITEGRDRLAAYLQSLDDGDYSLQVDEWQDKRSLRQNSYYWSIITIIGEELGYRKKQMHEAFLEAFAPIKTVQSLEGKPIQKPVRSSEMTIEQMTEYIETIIQFAAEQNIKLPQPEHELI